MNVIPFKPEHIGAMRVQQAQVGDLHYMTQQAREGLAAHPSYSGFIDGKLIACAGIVNDRHLWAVLSEDAGPYMLRLTRFGRLMVSLYPDLSTHVHKEFAPGCRWLSLLGFHVEQFIAGFGPDGSDHYIYRKTSWAT